MSKKLLIGAVLTALALGVFAYVRAQDATPTPTTTPPTTPGVNLACMQTAVEKRDNAVISAWDALTASVKTTLSVRRDALKAAWGISDKRERAKAIKQAWTNFKNSKKEASRTFNQARKDAWKQFKTDARDCKATATYETEGSDVKF
jgi:uncharacterized membrane protein